VFVRERKEFRLEAISQMPAAAVRSGSIHCGFGRCSRAAAGKKITFFYLCFQGGNLKQA
jgi:hypothetical protein